VKSGVLDSKVERKYLKLRFSVNLQKKQFNQRNEWNPRGKKLIAITEQLLTIWTIRAIWEIKNSAFSPLIKCDFSVLKMLSVHRERLNLYINHD